ncbi:hypothetical protein PHMEG_00036461 [Phytophthora megakarya]|uniref:Uncharacterized protein n=1 Tax=Phytophthora megakarya TaxID=4795 RepID=A0A225ULU6_9STRA|nr:hypothetical protein PHMEG_00036461 [Phytophthora megakarya]
MNINHVDTTYRLLPSLQASHTSLSVFLGLIDIVVVNVFIVYREAQKQRGEAPADHAEFLQILQAQLLQTTSADFADERGVIAETHKLSEFPEWTQIREGVRKRPQHQCKVCSIRKTKEIDSAEQLFYR